ncbi:hypothetical protein F383_31516 [Gossypium arboreum]|uniref:Uncharacterized protein n=1 Tax=Gossypium arboreum TaxID=29729 RepID=A0A0B0PL25_GOSAR|nr:hypothetical protein F383_31516 [Gossypium arboreum]
MDDYVLFTFVVLRVARFARVGGRQRYYHTIEFTLLV